MSSAVFGKFLLQLLEGMGVTLEIFFLTLIFSVPLGVLVTILRLSKNKIVSAIKNDGYDVKEVNVSDFEKHGLFLIF